MANTYNDKLREVVKYISSIAYLDYATGAMIVASRDFARRRGIGQRIGHIKDGEWRVRYDGKRYRLSHVIYAMVTGMMPVGRVVYLDGNSLNCRPDNLACSREAKKRNDKRLRKEIVIKDRPSIIEAAKGEILTANVIERIKSDDILIDVDACVDVIAKMGGISIKYSKAVMDTLAMRGVSRIVGKPITTRRPKISSCAMIEALRAMGYKISSDNIEDLVYNYDELMGFSVAAREYVRVGKIDAGVELLAIDKYRLRRSGLLAPSRKLGVWLP